MAFIIGVIMIIYFIEIAWTWQSLGFIEKNKKVIVILVGTIIMYGITSIVFQMAKKGMNYPNMELQNSTKHILVAIFTGVNGIIIMPQIGKMLDKINEDQMEKSKFQKRILILAIVFIACLIFETSYMKQTQVSILKMDSKSVPKETRNQWGRLEEWTKRRAKWKK